MTFSPLQFIRANPATQAFDEREEHNRLRREEERTFATDEAIRTGLAENERARNDPVVGRLLDVPGAGETALGIQQQSAERQDEMERLAMTALGRGEMEVYAYWRDQSGLRVPPEIEADSRARDLFSRGSLMAYRLYGRDNPGQASAFLQSFVQSGGDVQAAFGAAGSPTGRPRITATVADAVGNEVNLLVNSRGTPVTTNLPEGLAYARDSNGNLVAVPIPGAQTNQARVGTPPVGVQYVPTEEGSYQAVPVPGLDPMVTTGVLPTAPATPPAPANAPTPSQFTPGGALDNPYGRLSDDELLLEAERHGVIPRPGASETIDPGSTFLGTP